jgi:hypothetical protein
MKASEQSTATGSGTTRDNQFTRAAGYAQAVRGGHPPRYLLARTCVGHIACLLIRTGLDVEIWWQSRKAKGQQLSTYLEWESGAGVALISLVAVLDACQSTCRTECASALLSDADQLRAASRDFQTWLHDQPCPDPDLNLSVVRVGRSLAYLATSFEVVARSAQTVSWRVVERELSDLRVLVADTHSMMSARSKRRRRRTDAEG